MQMTHMWNGEQPSGQQQLIPSPPGPQQSQTRKGPIMLRSFKHYVVFCVVLGASELGINLVLYFRGPHSLFNIVFGIVACLLFAVGLPLMFRKMFPPRDKPGP